MNGDSAGLEPADRSRKASAVTSRETLDQWRQTAADLEVIGEYKAAREVCDASDRLLSVIEASEASEGERSRKTVHGEDPQNAEVKTVG